MIWNPALYDAKHGFVWQHGAALIDLLQPQAGERVLDLGCGTGHLTTQLAAAGADVLGVDLSDEMIAAARTQHPELRFEVMDARSLPFDAEFDAVLSNAVLHWVKEADAAAASIAKALRRGGRFVAEFGGRGNVRCLWSAVERASKSVLGHDVESPWYFPSLAEYTAVLERAGLETTYATLFDRATPLEGEHGLRHWIAMFGDHVLARVPGEQREEFFEAVEDRARSSLLRDGAWHADYRRIRVVAGSAD